MREILQTIFFIYLARQSAATYGEFMLALGLGSILIMVAEFGLNLPLVSLLGRKQGDTGKALFQVSLLKAVLLLLAAGVALGLVYWQDYSRSLKQVMLVLSAGVALDRKSVV